MLNKSTEAAIAALSRLAEVHGQEGPGLTAAEIAGARNLSRPFVAKVLTILSGRGLVRGSPGRRGGYVLTRPPAEITLLDIAACFERLDRPTPCPFGPGHCGRREPCPLHERFATLATGMRAILSDTTLAVFAPRSGPA
jgi:Rrf2 family protein